MCVGCCKLHRHGAKRTDIRQVRDHWAERIWWVTDWPCIQRAHNWSVTLLPCPDVVVQLAGERPALHIPCWRWTGIYCRLWCIACPSLFSPASTSSDLHAPLEVTTKINPYSCELIFIVYWQRSAFIFIVFDIAHHSCQMVSHSSSKDITLCFNCSTTKLISCSSLSSAIVD